MTDETSTALSDAALRFIMRRHSGAATRADAEAFAQWRAQSPAHEAAAREAEAIWGESADLHQPGDSQTVRPGRKPRKPGGGTLAGLALTVALAGAGGAYVHSTGGWTAWTADETTGIGQTRAMTLADGSRVTLNAGSAINVAMNPGTRRVTLLRGEAFFDVASDARRPFTVEVDGLGVTARGTAFDIDRRADGEIDVAVTDHAVTLAPRVGREMVLGTGKEATIDNEGKIDAVGDIDKASVASWREGLLVAEDRPLTAIVDSLRAYHRGWIVLRDPALARLRVNAVLDLKSPEAALRTLEKGLPIRVSTLSPLVILIAPR